MITFFLTYFLTLYNTTLTLVKSYRMSYRHISQLEEAETACQQDSKSFLQIFWSLLFI